MGKILIPTSEQKDYEGCLTNNPDFNPLNMTKKIMPKEERDAAIKKAEEEMKESLGPELIESMKNEALSLVVDLINNGPGKVTVNLEELPLDPKRPVSKTNPVQVGLSMRIEREAKE